MADEETAPKTTRRGSQEALEKQVEQMRREITKINKALAERAEEAIDQANGWYSGAAERASKATQTLRAQAQSVSETVKENPGTLSTAMIVGGMIGFVLGYVVGQSSEDRYRRWY
ncbi:hypothetical protein [Aminobacter sp. AP02]|uniref:hypothetical protein n=1 Tax=Aminobacter sp. AP02 TaxID=2135737 RepID=UPI000D6AEEF5|nr:hypothetical protein [Aminobacter sp. AP02]PWK69938.1 hypothetical protein C8K44_108238 [Aminobacter sp. AP02]